MKVHGEEISLQEYTEMVIKMSSDTAARVALEKANEEKMERLKNRFDKRLYNTELLLKNYRIFEVHRDDSIYSAKKAIEILNELDEYSGQDVDDDLIVESIKRSSERTAVIIAHIDKMLSIYRYIGEASCRPEDIRRYKIITQLYIDEKQKTPEEICTDMSVTQRTFYRDRKAGIQFLRGLIFGVDGIKTR